jgi:hypothetical protein
MPEHNEASSETEERQQEDRVRRFLRRTGLTGIAIAVWVFVGSFFLLRLYLYEHITTEPYRTIALIDSMFSLAIVIVIVVHAVMYNKQAEVMERQETLTRDALVISNRATVAVHSIEMNKARKTVLVRIENTGNQPAGDISVFLRLFTFGPPEWNGKDDPPNQETKSASVRVSYGRTKLFKGNLPILLTFFLSDWTDSEFRNIEKGTHGLTLIGYIEYSDGFFPEPIRRTEFVLGYLSELGVWSTDSPDFADTVGWEGEDTEEI